MNRGDLVTVALAGDFGKPRPAVIIQADNFDTTDSVTLLLISGTLVDASLLRVTVHPDETNGLRKSSQVMIDKTMTVRRNRIGQSFGRLSEETMISITRSLALFLGIA
ncbi:type II toxin-antitoxin system PemK/MazF family toxin [Rhizobium sp. SIMBA_035]|jgi:mRNA interferase MazF